MTRPHRPAREAGFGLLLVVVLLALMGVMSLGAFEVARREFRHASELRYADQAFEAAESGLAVAASAAGGLGAGPPFMPVIGPSAGNDRTRFATTSIRLNGSLVLLTSIGERLDGAGQVLARRSLGLVGTLVPGVGSAPPRFVPLESRAWAQLYD